MAHELDTKENGVAAMFSVIETPWHTLGTILGKAPSLKEAMKVGGLDFDVELRPLTTSFEVREGETIDVNVPENFAVVRTDRRNTDGILGVVGSSYRVLPNLDAFAVLEPLVDSGKATLETGGALRGGRDVWMMIRWNITDKAVRKVLKDEVIPFSLISNNHNGSRQVTLMDTPIRVVCANTLGAAHASAAGIKVRHTANVKTNVIDAATKLFENVTTRYQDIAKQYANMKEASLTQKKFEQVVLDVLAALPEKPKGEQTNKIATAAWERATERAKARRDRLTFLRDNGKGHKGDGSAWEAYNGAVESLDHDTDMWKAEDRLTALFDGSLATAKRAVLDSIVSAI